MSLNVTWWAIHPTTGVRVPLPDIDSWSLSPIANSSGALSLQYPVIGRNFATLNQFVTEKRDLEVEVWFDGAQVNARRGILYERSSDLVDEAQVVSFAGHFLEHLMSEMVVLPYAPHPKQETVFSAVSPGTVMATLMQRAQADGYLTGVTFSTFSGTTDSNGAAWTTSVTATYSPVQTTYTQILDELVEQGACEWEITATRQLRLFKVGTRGVDRTVGSAPTILRRGLNLTEVPTKVSSREAGTDLWAAGGEGLYHREFDAGARTLRGRQVARAYSATGITDAGALDAAATARLPAVTTGMREVTHGILFGAGDPAPVTDFDTSDWVYSNSGETSAVAGGGNERLRIRQWSLSRSRSGEYTGTVSLNDLFDEQLVRIARALARLQSGSTVVGTSTPGAPVDDGVAPAAPIGLTASSLAYQLGNSADTYASVTVSWSAVITDSNGNASTDISGYRVQYAYTSVSGGSLWVEATPADGVTGTTYTFSGAEAGVGMFLRVAAFDQFGNLSAWSATLGITTANDNTPPPVPSTPTARNFLRQLIVEWNGLGSAGQVMPIDFSYVEVHVSAASNFTPTAATLFERLYAKGGVVYDPGSYTGAFFFKLISVDLVGNKSVASAQATATPSRAIADDIGDQIISSAKLADGAVLGPKIAAEAVSTPHLSVATFSDNLLPNGGFEDVALTGTLPASWVADGSGGGTHTFTRNTVAANVRSGGAAAQLALSAASGFIQITSDSIPTKPGDNWYFELSAKASRAVNGLLIFLGVGDTDPASTTFPTLLNAGALTTAYPAVPVGLNYTVPATVGAGVVPKYLRLYVRAGDVVGDAAALTVWADEVRARKVVGTAEIQDAAISRAKIGLLAVGDAQIETASIGKLTTGTLTATVLLSGIIRTATTGARSEMDSAGIRLYNSANTNTVNLSATSGSALVTGEFRTSLTGQRLIFNPGGTLPDTVNFYPTGAGDFARIMSRTAPADGSAAVLIDGGATGSVGRGRVGAYKGEAFVSYVTGDPGGDTQAGFSRTAVSCSVSDVNLWAQTTIAFDLYQATTYQAMGHTYLCWKPGSGGSFMPTFTANHVNVNAGIKFDSGSVIATINEGALFGRLKANAFDSGSSETLKTDITDLRAVMTPLDVIRSARSKKWRYRSDVLAYGVAAPARFGPMAEDLPPQLVDMTPSAAGPDLEMSVNLGDQIGCLWGAFNQIIDQRLVHVTATVTPPPMATANIDIEIDVVWDGGPTQTIPAFVSIVPDGVGPLQQRAITAKLIASTITGATVRFRTSRPLIGGSALDIEDRYIVNAIYEYTPPFDPGAP